MEFIKISNDRYMIKDSNSIIVSEEEKLKLEKRELIIEDFKSDKCQKNTTLKIKEINKKLNGRKNIKSDTIEETTTTTK